MDPDQPAELLCEERQVLVGWQGNPALAATLDAAGFSQLGHVAVHVGSNHVPSFADRQLERMGIARRIELTCGCFTLVPWLLSETRRVAVLHERLAVRMAAHFPLAIARLPFAFPVMREMVQYHRTREADEGLRWLRQQLRGEVLGQPAINGVDP